jgi:hypothetical protein
MPVGWRKRTLEVKRVDDPHAACIWRTWVLLDKLMSTDTEKVLPGPGDPSKA